MLTPPLNESPENTHQAVLFYLKRSSEMTVADLCEALGVTSMAVRRHLSGLQKDGLVECRLVRQSRGRPTYRYRLSPKAESLFPSAINNFAFEILDAVYDAKGHKGVMELLQMRDEALLKKLLPSLEKLPLPKRVQEVVKIFSENGYMTDFKALDDGNYFIYQQHCAVHNLASKYKQLCVLESKLLEQLLGVKTARQQYIMKEDPVCGYLVLSNQALDSQPPIASGQL
ncbi:MAG: MarR family transcriptional regulator [Candidatus Obscuribacterales bacterium]|nr:MarR family transcriptional regulator [Candidatus Obscuribacterales bacterium]